MQNASQGDGEIFPGGLGKQMVTQQAPPERVSEILGAHFCTYIPFRHGRTDGVDQDGSLALTPAEVSFFATRSIHHEAKTDPHPLVKAGTVCDDEGRTDEILKGGGRR